LLIVIDFVRIPVTATPDPVGAKVTLRPTNAGICSLLK
jgi:hypothetical protein